MATEKDLIDCMASYQWDQLNEQLAAKDREIAELRRQLDRARYNAEAADSFRAAYCRERDEALEQLTELQAQRDEARECVGRLIRGIHDIAGETEICIPDVVDRVLAGVPEHLRNA
jgi:uncharacterized coiled-coil DUF342 family protein